MRKFIRRFNKRIQNQKEKGISIGSVVLILMLMSIIAISSLILGGDTLSNKTIAMKLSNYIDEINKAIELHFADTGVYPSKTKQLYENGDSLAGWNGPYITLKGGTQFKNKYMCGHLTKALYSPSFDTYIAVFGSATNYTVCIETPSTSVRDKLDTLLDDGNSTSGKCVYYDAKTLKCTY